MSIDTASEYTGFNDQLFEFRNNYCTYSTIEFSHTELVIGVTGGVLII